ncbi:hypothetical protein U9M48_036396 [Paspalum notatum var. saurae]|uniref:Uncharacterized protein n=1 Tax=Paspalum notatum var. saurae TaxID=547442 RepID=A0AAQ3UEE3_PASNO
MEVLVDPPQAGVNAMDGTALENIRLVSGFLDVFPDSLLGMPPERDIEFSIELVPGTAPIYKKAYRIAGVELLEVKKQIDELLEKGGLNAVTVKNKYPLPRIEDLFDELKGHVISNGGIAVDQSKVSEVQNWKIPRDAKDIMSFLGLAGYYRRFIEGFSKIAKPMTALLEKNIKFQWTSARQEAFEELKKRLTTTLVLTFPDMHKPFSVYCDASQLALGCVLMQEGKTEEEHEEHPRLVLQKLGEHKLYAKFSNCDFWIAEVKFLGHVISNGGIAVDQSKVSEVQNWKMLGDAKDIMSFLGLAGYYRRFIEGFSKIAKPMTALLEKNIKFQWTSARQEAFEELKKRLTTTLVLTFPDMHKPFSIYCDASRLGLGCVLMQEGKVIAYASRQLRDHEKDSVHQSLWMEEEHEEHPRLVLQKLREHKLYAKFSNCDFWIAEVKFLGHVISNGGIAVDQSKEGKVIAYASRQLRDHEKNYPTHDLELAVVVHALKEAHETAYSIHPSSEKMYHDLKLKFWWYGMKHEVAEYVALCDVCQRVKAEHQKSVGLLQPLKIPEWKWTEIGMDFIKCLRVPEEQLQVDDLNVQDDLTYTEYPVQILEMTERTTRNKVTKMCKVKWSHHTAEEATWERKDDLRADYLELFASQS